MKKLTQIITLFIIFPVLTTAKGHKSKDDAWFSYQRLGGWALTLTETVNIYESGDCEIDLGYEAYRFTLTESELLYLRKQLEMVDLFAPDFSQHVGYMDALEVTISVKNGDKKQTGKFEVGNKLMPLYRVIKQLVMRAYVLSRLNQFNDLDRVRRYVNPNRNENKLYNSNELVVPVKICLEQIKKQRLLIAGIESLAWLLPPSEWAGYLFKKIEENETLWLGLLTSKELLDNIPNEHIAAICPIIFSISRKMWKRYSLLSKEERVNLSQSLFVISKYYHRDAFEFLEKILEVPKDEITKSIFTVELANYLTQPIYPADTMLCNEHKNSQLNTLELILISYKNPFLNGVSGKNKKSFLEKKKNIFSGVFSERINQMTSSDYKHKEVRELAKKVLAQINKEFSKWEASGYY